MRRKTKWGSFPATGPALGASRGTRSFRCTRDGGMALACTFALETVIIILYLLVLVPMLALVATVGSGSKSARGTKKIDIPSRHVVIGFVASHPDAEATEGSSLAAEVLGMLPEGTFVVAHPRTARLRAYYRLRGFEESKGKVMVKRL